MYGCKYFEFLERTKMTCLEHVNVHFVTDRNEVVAKVMFLLVSVILLTGGRV